VPAQDENDLEQRFKNHREQANWVLKQLLDCGWIERQVDTATLQSHYPFSRLGRLFAQTLIESDSTQIRTRHRNTRNTLNSLEAFHAREEVYDLLDAYEYSERIISDFTDIISELESRKRQLVKEVESQQLAQKATDQFFDFMEKRFQPDISVRLSADSVEKHREEISKVITKIRRKKNEHKKTIELNLRRTVPGLYDHNNSYLMNILEAIEIRMAQAAETMLPALRSALHGFTKRADIIIRQLSYLNTQRDNNLLDVCRQLRNLSTESFENRLELAAGTMATFKLQLVEPEQIRLHERKTKLSVDSVIKEQTSIDRDAQKELMIQQLLDQAFFISNESLKSYVLNELKDNKRLSSKHLPTDTAEQLLAAAHIIEVGAINNLSTDLQFHVEFKQRVRSPSKYFQSYDEFTIELIEDKRNNAHKPEID